MGYVLTRKCSREGCDRPRADVGQMCAEHRAADPPRPYRRWDGSPLKECAKCGVEYPVDSFRVAKGRPVSYCQPCQNAINQAYRARHHAELLARRRSQRVARRAA